MRPINPKTHKKYDQIYMIYSKTGNETAISFLKYAGIFSEMLLQHHVSNRKNNNMILGANNFYITQDDAKWFKLSKDEVMTHVLLEKIAENI
jgi:hypothetical protein